MWLVCAAVLLTFVVLRSSPLARSTRSQVIGRAAALAWIAILVPWSAAPKGLELWALDVGSGTAVAWRAPGAGAWVFDAGSRDRPDVAREAVLPLLRAWEAARLSIVLSHADRDHDGALPYIASRVPPTVWMGAVPAHCAERLPHTIARLDVRTGAARYSDPNGLAVSLERGLERDDNEGSRTARIRFGEYEIVLCGDAEAEGLREWLASEPHERAARVLLLPHHGSDSTWLGPLLASTRPREVWVSGPAEIPIAAELGRRRLDWRWTARDGPLRVELDLLRLPNLAGSALP
jgi:competence protein ComEC